MGDERYYIGISDNSEILARSDRNRDGVVSREEAPALYALIGRRTGSPGIPVAEIEPRLRRNLRSAL